MGIGQSHQVTSVLCTRQGRPRRLSIDVYDCPPTKAQQSNEDGEFRSLYFVTGYEMYSQNRSFASP
jgi:hypothetical protein